MSEVKRYDLSKYQNGYCEMEEDSLGDYVDYTDYKNLEQQITELKESQKQKQIIRLCNRLDKAEQQNKELIEVVVDCIDALTYNDRDNREFALEKAVNVMASINR